ncbi:MAG: tRNA dihydrouridine(20/20a) synthase DusA [Salinisphaera sp.]|nr:tRNA dihydrouridine(20/20a) synthase DusA [Salinisphaera sp.]
MPADFPQHSHRLCVAPMMQHTTRHCRYFHRLLSPHARLYTEMLTTGAILHGDRRRLLRHHPAEHPLALQVGGSEPRAMARVARIAEDYGFDEININAGCPSDRVQRGRFGACLMAEPQRVADCVAAMRSAATLPVTVKTRIGIDHQDDEAFLYRFVDTVAAADCRLFIIHARKAWLSGLSPKANREVPPLDYGRVHRLKRARPELTIVLNGGITEPGQVQNQLQQVAGVMLGRAAYQYPYLLAQLEQRLYGDAPLSRRQAVASMQAYANAHKGTPIQHISRHMLGLFHGCHGGRQWRRQLSEHAHHADAGPALLTAALPPLQTPVPEAA